MNYHGDKGSNSKEVYEFPEVTELV